MDISKLFDRIIETDVLSVGGSGAGVTAAIAALRKGVSVTLVSKGKVGNSGNAIMAGGSFSIDGESAYEVCKIKEANKSYTKDKLFQDIVKESYYISDQNIVEQFVEDAPMIVKEVLDWGERAGQKFLFLPPGAWLSSGKCWGKALEQGIRENHGIQVIEDTIIVELVKNGGRIAGAIGIDIYTGKLILFKAKAVILGTGGYQPFSFKNTVTDMTGDGVAMAYRAGAKLADMEFLLCFPTALSPNELKGSIYPFVFEFNMRQLNVQARNGKGELIEIPEKIAKIAKGSKLSKLVSTYYWGKEIDEGRGTLNKGVYLDYSNNSKEDLENAFHNFFTKFSIWYKYGYYKGEDLSEVTRKVLNKEYLEVGLGYEYSMGGILIDEKMQTSIPGLYAAGEVTSGLFGACRVGDGLTEMLAQGYKAGEMASQYVNESNCNEVDLDEIKTIVEDILKPLNRREGFSPIRVHHEIEEASDYGFGFRRDEKRLLETLRRLEVIKNEMLPNLAVKDKSRLYNYEWISSMQVKNLLICVEAGVKAALMRKESRGCHIRTDYPQVDNDNWLTRIIVSNLKGEMALETRKPIVTRISLPEGKEKSIMDYYLNKNLKYKVYD